jgi:hypothetical protein
MKGKKNDIKNIYFGGVDSLSLDDVDFEDSNEESTICKTKKKLDRRVNTAITCEHGKCHSMYKRRSVRLVPATVWSKILKVFPQAIAHSMESKTDECIGNCAACFQEKQQEELFPLKLTEWRDQIKLPGTLRDLYTKGGNDEEVGSITPPEIEIFLNDCALSGDASNKLTCYIVQCREIQRWRDAYDAVVKAKKARKTNNFIRNQLNELLFTSPSDDSESREWNFRSLICGDHKRSVGFPAPDNDAIRENVIELKEWLALLSAAKFGLLLEEEFRSFISSLSSLEKILHGNNSSTGLDQVTPTVSISIRGGVSRIDVQPSPCTDGCAVSLFGDEVLDNGIICKKIEEGKIAAPQAEVVPVDEDNGGSICKVIVHQIESGMSAEVAASQILLTLSSNEVEDAPNQGRRLRKRKARGSFPTHEIEMALNGNLAHFRLLLSQVSRESVCNQRLFMLPQALHHSSITELSHGSDEDTMLDLISKACGCCNAVAGGEDQTVHIIMTYTTKPNRGTGKRMTKEESDKEDAIIGILTKKACGGWKTADVAGRGKKPGKRQERGFQGLLLFMYCLLLQTCKYLNTSLLFPFNTNIIGTMLHSVTVNNSSSTEVEDNSNLEAKKVTHKDESMQQQQRPIESPPNHFDPEAKEKPNGGNETPMLIGGGVVEVKEFVDSSCQLEANANAIDVDKTKPMQQIPTPAETTTSQRRNLGPIHPQMQLPRMQMQQIPTPAQTATCHGRNLGPIHPQMQIPQMQMQQIPTPAQTATFYRRNFVPIHPQMQLPRMQMQQFPPPAHTATCRGQNLLPLLPQMQLPPGRQIIWMPVLVSVPPYASKGGGNSKSSKPSSRSKYKYRERKPRSCSICGMTTCKGSQNRTLCTENKTKQIDKMMATRR